MLSWRANEAKGKTADDTNEYKAVFAVTTKNAADERHRRLNALPPAIHQPNQRCIPDTGVPASDALPHPI